MEKVVLYGAGKVGIALYTFLKTKGKEESIVGFIDKKAHEIGSINNIPVWTFEEYKQGTHIPVMIAIGKVFRDEVIKLLEADNIDYINTISDLANHLNEDAVEWNRDYCAFSHIDGFEHYFSVAENQLDIFWNENSVFCQMFHMLNTENILEMACGRGRHVKMYVDSSKKVTLVDILQKNIDFCKSRYKDYSNIFYYTNNGYDLCDLPDNEYSAIFCYDAMVHFEMMDIFSYLKEFHRVMKPGALALLHHSNNTSDYKVSYQTGEHSRSYMSKDLFAYLAYRVGFDIIKQEVIDWGASPKLDCVSLIKKRLI